MIDIIKILWKSEDKKINSELNKILEERKKNLDDSYKFLLNLISLYKHIKIELIECSSTTCITSKGYKFLLDPDRIIKHEDNISYKIMREAIDQYNLSLESLKEVEE